MSDNLSQMSKMSKMSKLYTIQSLLANRYVFLLTSFSVLF